MNWEKISKTSLLVFIILLCWMVLAPITTKADFWHNDEYIEQIDKSISDVLKLEAGAAAASAIITFLPDDQCTPVANQLAELAKYFLIVLCALYLEKYLIGIMGYVSFRVIVPLACGICIYGIWKSSEMAKSLALRLGVCAILIYLIIPASMWCSSTIYNNYENSIDETIAASDELEAQQIINESEEDVNGITGLLGWVKETASSAVDYASRLLSDFVEALAVVIVTSCLIPVFVFILFSWILKSLFDIDLTRAFITKISTRQER